MAQASYTAQLNSPLELSDFRSLAYGSAFKKGRIPAWDSLSAASEGTESRASHMAQASHTAQVKSPHETPDFQGLAYGSAFI